MRQGAGIDRGLPEVLRRTAAGASARLLLEVRAKVWTRRESCARRRRECEAWHLRCSDQCLATVTLLVRIDVEGRFALHPNGKACRSLALNAITRAHVTTCMFAISG